MDKKTAAHLPLELHLDGDRVAFKLVCSADRLVCLQKRDAVLEFHLDVSRQVRYRAFRRRQNFAVPKGTFSGLRIFAFNVRFSARSLRATRLKARSAAAMKASLFASCAEGLFFAAVQDLKISRAFVRTSCSFARRIAPML